MAPYNPAPFAWNYCPICGQGLHLHFDGESDRPYCAPCARYYYRNPAPAVCCLVRNAEGGLLVVQRAEDPCRGEWSLPGGYMEIAESCEEAVCRELAEETGLRARNLRFFDVRTQGSATHGAVLLLAYHVETWDGELCSPDGQSALGFYTKENRPPLCFDLHRHLVADFEAWIQDKENLRRA